MACVDDSAEQFHPHSDAASKQRLSRKMANREYARRARSRRSQAIKALSREIQELNRDGVVLAKRVKEYQTTNRQLREDLAVLAQAADFVIRQNTTLRAANIMILNCAETMQATETVSVSMVNRIHGLPETHVKCLA